MASAARSVQSHGRLSLRHGSGFWRRLAAKLLAHSHISPHFVMTFAYGIGQRAMWPFGLMATSPVVVGGAPWPRGVNVICRTVDEEDGVIPVLISERPLVNRDDSLTISAGFLKDGLQTGSGNTFSNAMRMDIGDGALS